MYQEALALLQKSGKPLGCTECGETPIEVQLRDNQFPYGRSPSGRALDTSEFAVQLLVELEEPDHPNNRLPLEQLIGFCALHVPMRNSPGPDKPTTKSDGETAHERTLRLKAAALQAYGGQCADCGQDDSALLVLCLKDEVLDPAGNSVWKELGVTSWAHKWIRLAELDYPQICLVRCLTCRSEHSNLRGPAVKTEYAASSKRERAAIRKTGKSVKLRAEALAAYGGKCACGQANPSLLWLVRRNGAAPVVYESGRKLTARQRNERLKRDGWPPTHYVTCQPCWKQSRKGQGGGY